jgi:hypothetical protein
LLHIEDDPPWIPRSAKLKLKLDLDEDVAASRSRPPGRRRDARKQHSSLNWSFAIFFRPLQGAGGFSQKTFG